MNINCPIVNVHFRFILFHYLLGNTVSTTMPPRKKKPIPPRQMVTRHTAASSVVVAMSTITATSVAVAAPPILQLTSAVAESKSDNCSSVALPTSINHGTINDEVSDDFAKNAFP